MEESELIEDPTFDQEPPDVVTETTVPRRSGNRENFSGDVLAQIVARKTRVGAAAISDSREVIQRHVYSFVLEGDQATPDFFVDDNGEYFDVMVTLRSLTSREEIAALQGVTDGSAAPMKLARACLWKLNDRALSEEEKELVWEGLGMKGRQLCMLGFNVLGGASQSALGKFRRTLSPS